MNASRDIGKIIEVLKYLIGPVLFLIIVNSHLNTSGNTKLFLAVFSMVISLWLLTPVPLFISGILGVSLSAVLGIVTPREAFSPFADPVIFLFLGGFLLARALEKSELDQRIAKMFLGHPWVSISPERNVLAFLGLSFVLSMWISNTAAVAMLLPISFGVIKKLEVNYGIKDEKFNEKLLIGLAFAATVGGSVTPIGSPPNVIALGLLKNISGKQVSFLEWMFFATPISLILFYLVYRKCAAALPKSKGIYPTVNEVINYEKFSKLQKYVLVIFFTTVSLWVVPSFVSLFVSESGAIHQFLLNNLSASVVSVFCASLLFLVPLFESEKILDSGDVSQIDWSSLLLFGAGLSLGNILFKTGGAGYLMMIIKEVSGGLGPTMIITFLLLFTIFFTEIASNTATANIILPVVIALGIEFGLSPTVLAITFALACNSAFMLPVATPPNTIVFGTKRVQKITMIKSGLRFNLIGFFILALMNLILNKMSI
ncbi:MAG: sodium-dependent dicarboxylate transporter 2/3/5 [Bacteriovoracaceae bacterium]|jgi:sodium-dependent dicarboxylate transporter 2/3/5